ncbi:MAG: Xaa-Pro dipeptidase [Lachnospiraceae bacterium]|nr:Xaa-Pro dipeptidase [Lachnospiraceae bacterium]
MRTNIADCHCHIALDGADYSKISQLHKEIPNEDFIRANFLAYAQKGVSFLRDGGDKWGCSSLAKALSFEYGIDYRTPHFAIHKKGSYGSILGRSFEDFNEFKELVSKVKNLSGDFVKIMASGIMDFNTYGVISECSLTGMDMKDMFAFCHDFGYAVMVHVNGDKQIKEALLAGADSIEHGYYMNEDTLHLMKDLDAIWVPTIAPVALLTKESGFNSKVMEIILDNHRKNIKKALSMGVHIAPGSDAGSFGVAHVTGAKKEYEFLYDIAQDKERLGNIITESVELIKMRFKKA